MVCYIRFSQQEKMELSVFKKSVLVATKWLRSNARKIDDSLRRYVMSQDCKVGHMLVSECSSTAQVEETGDKKNHDEEAGDALQVQQVLEKQTSGGSTQEAKTKKGKGKNKGKKGGKKGKGKN